MPNLRLSLSNSVKQTFATAANISPDGSVENTQNLTINTLQGYNANAFAVVAAITDSAGHADGGNEIMFSIDSGAFANSSYIQERSDGSGNRVRYAYQSATLQFLFDPYGNTFPKGCTINFGVMGNEAGDFYCGANGAIFGYKATGTSQPGYTTLRGRTGATGGNAYSQGTVTAEFYAELTPEEFKTKMFSTEMQSSITNQGTDLIIVSGQSDCADKDPAASHSYTNTSQMKLVDYDGTYGAFSDAAWIDKSSALITGFDDGTTYYGSGAVGTVLDELCGALNRDIAAVPAWRGTTEVGVHWGVDLSIAAQTNSDANVKHWGTMSVASFFQMQIARQHGKPKAWVIRVGQLNAANGTAAAFESNLPLMVAQMRDAWHMPNLPVIVVGLHKWGATASATEANWNAVQAAQEAAAGVIPKAYFVDLSDLDGLSGDETHLSSANQEVAGERIAASILANVYGQA